MRWDQMPSISEPAPNALAKVGFWSEDRLGQGACYILVVMVDSLDCGRIIAALILVVVAKIHEDTAFGHGLWIEVQASVLNVPCNCLTAIVHFAKPTTK
ncbi:MAG TPA: hypothetical protein VFI27_18555 [candidate division Zixibacteria bacterium]|nr:hypothetical protein [candidate division Zixibacteria bacterium]